MGKRGNAQEGMGVWERKLKQNSCCRAEIVVFWIDVFTGPRDRFLDASDSTKDREVPHVWS